MNENKALSDFRGAELFRKVRERPWTSLQVWAWRFGLAIALLFMIASWPLDVVKFVYRGM